jgi:hypothetical protein
MEEDIELAAIANSRMGGETVEIDINNLDREENKMEAIALRTHRESMKYELSQGLCEVTFTKINGDERVMTCTTDLGAIPEGNRPKGTGKENKTNTVVSVWDIKAEGWRSFKSENVTKFKALRYSDGKEIEKLLDF